MQQADPVGLTREMFKDSLGMSERLGGCVLSGLCRSNCRSGDFST